MNFFKKFFKGLSNVLDYELIPRSYQPFDVRWQMFSNHVEWLEKIRKCVCEEIIDEYSKREDYNINRKNNLEYVIKNECTNIKIAYALGVDIYNNHRNHILEFRKLYRGHETFSLINTLYDDNFVILKQQINDDPDLEAVDLRRGLNNLDKNVIEILKNNIKLSIEKNWFFPEEREIPDYEDDYDKN